MRTYKVYYTYYNDIGGLSSDSFVEEFTSLKEADAFAQLMIKLWYRRKRRDKRISREHSRNLQFYQGFDFRKEYAHIFYYFVGINGNVRCGRLPWYVIEENRDVVYDDCEVSSIYVKETPLPYYHVGY